MTGVVQAGRAALLIVSMVFFSPCAARDMGKLHPHDARSPSGAFLIRNSRAAEWNNNDTWHLYRLSLARRGKPRKFHKIYKFPRYAYLCFSPQERYIAVDDQRGSGAARCAVLHRIAKPPFFVPNTTVFIDKACWGLFWSRHVRPWQIHYTHQQTYPVRWLDDRYLVVGMGGENFFADEGGRWYLEGGWHCLYDVKQHRAFTNPYTTRLNRYSKYTLFADAKAKER